MSTGKYRTLSHCYENPKSRNYIIDIGVIKCCINICNWAYCCGHIVAEEMYISFFMKNWLVKLQQSPRFNSQYPRKRGVLIYPILYPPPFLLHGSIVLCRLVWPRRSSVVGHEVSHHHKPHYLPCIRTSRTTRVWLCTTDWRAI